MNRLAPVIAELEAARNYATARFAAEANMPVEDFLRHFVVVVETAAAEETTISFRVEPRPD